MKIRLFVALSICLVFSCDPIRAKSVNENPRTSAKTKPEVAVPSEPPVVEEKIVIAPKTSKQSYRVDYIIDGDTFWAKSDSDRFKVRVLGIDCPEVTVNSNCEKDAERGGLTCAQQIPLGKAVKTVANRQLKDKMVSLVSGTDNPPKKDKYRRVLAYVEFENGDDYGLQMVKTKRCDPSYFPHPRQAEYGKP